ncbi:DUF2750 domain-containing protein [Nocardioides sp.]|uniref:DUF2750 domain-containing protein n=1 Tax=Nocardioides sp. TaxID=35761 RepID=UPI002B70FD8B|nr:DUF2750 domain-containing protein [Nocardioides sp.]HXH80026.1 DUF2750 domain-containing protein [Nocardioides sp.]
MSVAAAHADAFYREVLAGERVYALRDDAGFPAPAEPDGVRTMPFWSKASRAEAIIAHVEAYEGSIVTALSLSEWNGRWLPGLERDGLLVGLNWSGANATGYDISPAEVLANLNGRQGHGNH